MESADKAINEVNNHLKHGSVIMSRVLLRQCNNVMFYDGSVIMSCLL